jgi:DnaK suppressor protein
VTKEAPRAAAAATADLLTEAQLLKMKADDYMNAQQLAFFRHRLLAMKEEYLSNAGQTSEHLRENDMVPDPADRATIEEEHSLELRVRDRERKQMKKIDEAIARIDDGSYGWCEETGEPIGIARLLARPTATLSVEAQARRELKQKMYG